MESFGGFKRVFSQGSVHYCYALTNRIASSKGTKLINLQEKDKVSYSNSAYGYNVADVLDLKQVSTAIPKVSAVYMERLERALDNGKVNEAEKVILEAENEFGDESPIYYDLKNYLEVNRWVEGD